jgi:3D (Asp-Asp-Asp) domain-containing protein
MSAWPKVVATTLAMGAFVALYEVTIPDSKTASKESAFANETPRPGTRLRFAATAYCKGLTTASGVAVQKGAVASDPAVLPVGSIVEIDARPPGFDGVYTVLDTGPKIQGRLIDIYMWSCHDALRFGRQDIDLTVLRMGWNPQATAPTRSFMNRWFRRREQAPQSSSELPPRPLPVEPQ